MPHSPSLDRLRRALTPALCAALLLPLLACRSPRSPVAMAPDVTPAGGTPAVAVTPPQPWAESGLTRRGQWRVTTLPDGSYRMIVVLDSIDFSRWNLAAAESAASRDWPAWATAGFPEATRLQVVELDPASAASRQVFLFNADSVHDGGQKGTRLAGAAERPAKLDWADLHAVAAGIPVSAGDGVLAPVPLPDNMRTDEMAAWLGFMGQKWEDSKNATPVERGWALFAVGALSAFDAAGVGKDDIVVSLGPFPRNDPMLANLYQGVAHRYRVGDSLTLEWIAETGPTSFTIKQATVSIPAFPFPSAPMSPGLRAATERLAAPAAPPAEQGLFDAIAAAYGHTADWQDLLWRLGDLNTRVDAYRLPAIAAAHQNPFAMESIARGYLAGLDGAHSPAGFAALPELAWRILQSEAAEPPPLAAAEDDADATTPAAWVARDDADLNAHLDYMEAVLAAAAAHHANAFARLSAEDLTFLGSQAEDYLQSFVEAHMMIYNPLPAQRANIRLLQVAQQVDMRALLLQAQVMQRLTDPVFLQSLQGVMTAAADAGKTGRIAQRKTPQGLILLENRGDDQHRNEAAILVDLGGDDVYINNSGASVPGKVPSALLIDFGGDDRYESWELGTQGAGFFGCGLLLDLAGDDIYICRRGGQGFGFCGSGLLYDAAGTDTFRAMDYAQGVGQFGFGALVAGSGAKAYNAHNTSQGVGFTRGVGLLLGGSGDDSYYCKGQYASGYRDAGSFEGWGQGLGTGHRPYASGGVGLLVDRAGNDRYEGGSFSGGGGYYYGMGIQQDQAGNDRYRGSRYNQGFTAHQAVGVFLDDAGDDAYWQLHHVAQGMSWDESCTLFVEGAGDDVYHAPGFAFGTAAMNGFVLFKDLAGADRYAGAVPGGVSGNAYHGGSSVGYFLDLGPGDDLMHETRREQVIAVEKDVAYFVHAATIAAALEYLQAHPPPPPEPPPAAVEVGSVD